MLRYALLILVLSLWAVEPLRFSNPTLCARRHGSVSLSVKDPKRARLEDSLHRIYGDPDVEILSMLNTEKGDSASGVIVNESSDEITLDATPCDAKKTLISFHPIYKKNPVKAITCRGKKYNRVKVTQQ